MQRKHVTVCALCVCKLYTVRTECMMMMINCACENYGFVRCKLVYNRINNMLYISFGAFRSTIVAGICDSALRLFHCMSVELHICALWRNWTARARGEQMTSTTTTMQMMMTENGKWTEKNLSWIMTHVIVDYIANDFIRDVKENEKRIGWAAWAAWIFKCHLPSSPQIGVNHLHIYRTNSWKEKKKVKRNSASERETPSERTMEGLKIWINIPDKWTSVEIQFWPR